MSATTLPMTEQKSINFDRLLLACVIALICVGFIAMSSASMEYAAVKYNNPFFHIQRYGIHLLLGCVAALIAYRIPMSFWQQTGWLWLLFAFALLALVLIPGVGREVNGSRRWVALGPLTLQCSEIAKACVILYLAGYLVRRQQEVRERFSGFIKPMALLFFVTLLLLLEPDFWGNCRNGCHGIWHALFSRCPPGTIYSGNFECCYGVGCDDLDITLSHAAVDGVY